MAATLCHRGDCIYLMHSSVKNARSALCKVCMFGSSLRGETHLKDTENKLCREYKSPCARQDEWFYINYCSNTILVEPFISSLYIFKGRTPVLKRTWKVFIMHTNVAKFNVQYGKIMKIWGQYPILQPGDMVPFDCQGIRPVFASGEPIPGTLEWIRMENSSPQLEALLMVWYGQGGIDKSLLILCNS